MATNSRNKSKIHWSQEQEVLLKDLKEVQKISSWNVISKKINREFQGKYRTSKQCRQRYINFVRFEDQNSENTAWSTFEDQSLFLNFIQFGSSWTSISKQMTNRSQNSLKNRFYGIIRKLIRKMARYQKQLKRKARKPIRFESLVQILKQIREIKLQNPGKSQMTQLERQFIMKIGKQLIDCLGIQAQNQVQKSKVRELNQSVYQYNLMTKAVSKRCKLSVRNKICQDKNLTPSSLQSVEQKQSENFLPENSVQNAEYLNSILSQQPSDVKKHENSLVYALQMQIENNVLQGVINRQDLFEQLGKGLDFQSFKEKQLMLFY